MKTTSNFLAILMLLTFTVSLYAQKAQQWMIDKDHTSVNFDINHFFSTVNGSFTEADGTFYFDPENLQNSRFNFTVPVNSIDTNNKKRDTHLKSEDFFDASKYPKIHFESTRLERSTGNKYVVHGNLSIKDVTKKVSIPFEVKGVMDHPMMKGTQVLGLQFKTKLNRSDYSIGVGDWASDMVVGDTADVTINMELHRKI